jgi:hypothetical protein
LSRRRIALGLLNFAGGLGIAGSLYDLFVPVLPQNHLDYLRVADGQLDRRFEDLDLGMLRAIGGCLLAIGTTSLILINGPLRRGEGWAAVALLILVGVSEGINSCQMFHFGSPWYVPLAFVVLILVGVILVRVTTGQTAHEVEGRGRQDSR